MAESVNQKLTNIADAVRTLSDTTDKLSLAEMAAEIDAANAELAEQLTLIEEIAALVETKSLPDEEVERQAELIEQLKVAVEALPEATVEPLPEVLGTCTANVVLDSGEALCILATQVIDGITLPLYYEAATEEKSWTAPCGSIVIVGVPYAGHEGAFDAYTKATYLGPMMQDCIPDGIIRGDLISSSDITFMRFRLDAKPGEQSWIELYEE